MTSFRISCDISGESTAIDINGDTLLMCYDKVSGGLFLEYQGTGAPPTLLRCEISYISPPGNVQKTPIRSFGHRVFRRPEPHHNPCLTLKNLQGPFWSGNFLFEIDGIIVPATPASAASYKGVFNGLSAFEGEAFAKDSFTDWVVGAGDEEFHVHAGILMARSKVFKTMFASDMAEKKEKRLVMTNVGPGTVRKFLTKAYNGECETSADSVAEASALTKLFHMYEVDNGVRECQKLLSQKLNDNVADLCTILTVSHLYGFDRVFEKAVSRLRNLGDDAWSSPELRAISHDVLLAALKKATGKLQNKQDFLHSLA